MAQKLIGKIAKLAKLFCCFLVIVLFLMELLYVILHKQSWFVKMIHGLNHFLIQAFHTWGPKMGKFGKKVHIHAF